MTDATEQQAELVNVMRQMQDQLNQRIASDWLDRGFAWHRATWMEAGEAAEHLPGDGKGSVAEVLNVHAKMLDAIGWKWWKTLKDVDTDALRGAVGEAMTLAGLEGGDSDAGGPDPLPSREILQSMVESSAAAVATFDRIKAATGGLSALANLVGAAPVPLSTEAEAAPTLSESQMLEQVQLEVVDLWHFALSAAEEQSIPSEQILEHLNAGLQHDDLDLNSGRKIFGDLGLAALEQEWDGVALSLGMAMKSTGMSLDDLYAGYVEKNVLNFHRQNNGYNAKAGEVEYVKVWAGEEDNVHLKRLAHELREEQVPAAEMPDRLMERLSQTYKQLTQAERYTAPSM